MNESRQSKIEEIRKKSLETLRDARLAEQERQRLDARFSLNEAAPGAAAGGAAGGAGGGGGGASSINRMPRPLEGVVNSRYRFGNVALVGDLLCRESWGSQAAIVMNWMPTTKLGETISEINRELTADGKADAVSEEFDNGNDGQFWRQQKDTYVKNQNEGSLALLGGTDPLRRDLEYQYEDFYGRKLGKLYAGLKASELTEVMIIANTTININNPGTLLESIDAKGGKKTYPQGNELTQSPLLNFDQYAGADLGLFESISGFKGAWYFHVDPIIASDAEIQSQLDELKNAAQEAGQDPNGITPFDTKAYKEARWPIPNNPVDLWGDVVRIFDGPFPEKGNTYDGDTEQYAWQPAYVRIDTKANKKYDIPGQWALIDTIEPKRAIVDWDGNPVEVTFELEDLATEFRASRDGFLKGFNEVTLATGPYFKATKWAIANWEINYGNTGSYRKPLAKGGSK